jgi:hypothetical protein
MPLPEQLLVGVLVCKIPSAKAVANLALYAHTVFGFGISSRNQHDYVDCCIFDVPVAPR